MVLIRLICLPIILWALFGTQAVYAWRIESGEVTTHDTSVTASFTNVTFQHPFDVIPVVIVLPTSEGDDPATLRINNVSLTGFEVTTVEPRNSNAVHPGMTIHYMAIEPGVHTFADGTQIAANIHPTTTVQGRNVGATGWDTVSLGVTLSATASVVATIQTLNSETAVLPNEPTSPLMTVATRLAGTSTVQMALDRAEDNVGTVVQEDIGWVAFPSGENGDFADILNNTIRWDARPTADSIIGTQTCRFFTFSTLSYANPRVFSTKNRRDGGDGGWLRRCGLTATTIGLFIDEDLANDGERNHTTESANLLAFSESFHAEFTGRIDANKEVSTAPGVYALPGNSVRYKISAESIGNLDIDPNAIVLEDSIPTHTALKVTDIGTPGGGPVSFVQGSPSSELTYTFNSLSDLTDDLDFSNNDGVTFTYVPVADADGADPLVTDIRISPKGTFAATTSSGHPKFSIEFEAVIK